MEEIVLIGFGGHAKSIADSIERAGEYRIVGYTDIEERKSKYKYLGTDDRLSSVFRGGVKKAFVGIGYIGTGNQRNRAYNTLKEIGFSLPIIVDPSAIIADTVNIGEGTFVGKGVVINAEASIGRMTIINTNAVVEHECKISDYAHISVSAVLCGQVSVGEASFIGANSTVIQCMNVGPHIIIPAGVTVR